MVFWGKVFIQPLPKMQGEAIRTTCQEELITPMDPARFDSCYSWWPHHMKSSCSWSEIQQRATSTVAWATNRLKEQNTTLPMLPSSLLRRKKTLSLKALIHFSVQLYLNKKEDPNSWIPSVCLRSTTGKPSWAGNTECSALIRVNISKSL